MVLCVALRRGDKLIGVQSAEHRGRRQAFTPQQMRIARGIAHLASLALETARLVEELEAANRLKSEFVATMSHELRSPLNIIIGYHELLLDGGFGPLAEAQRDPLRRADRSARELLDLINATLDLSRLEAKRIALDLGDVAVADLVDEVGRELADAARAPARRGPLARAPNLPPLRTDRVKLKMVLKNLVENAVKFTERGRVALDARRGDGGVEFRVADTGVGIAPEAQAVIFEPFRQIDVGRGPMRGGAGLGLYIVKQLLAVLGGTIAVESEVGQRLDVPRLVALCRASSNRSATAPDAGSTGDRCRTRRSAAQNGRVRAPERYQRRSRSRGGPPRTAAAAAAGAARSALARFADLQRTAVERLPVECGDGLLGVVGRRHLHEGEPARPSAHAIGDDRDGDDLTAIGRERRAQPFFGGGVGEIADVELGAHLVPDLSVRGSARSRATPRDRAPIAADLLKPAAPYRSAPTEKRARVAFFSTA